MKKDKLSISEQHLFERFTAYNKKNLTVPIKDILKNYNEEIEVNPKV